VVNSLVRLRAVEIGQHRVAPLRFGRRTRAPRQKSPAEPRRPHASQDGAALSFPYEAIWPGCGLAAICSAPEAANDSAAGRRMRASEYHFADTALPSEP
jgi:hypothetical protein